MLMQIPKYFTPELLRLLSEMGHGDELLICDGNFPYKRYGKNAVVLPGDDITKILKDILRFFPLDQSVAEAAIMMENPADDALLEAYAKALAEAKYPTRIKALTRFAFYDYTNGVTGVIITADSKKCANIIIRKGVVTADDYCEC